MNPNITHNTRKPTLISIEGNIGAGKTTLLEKIETFLETHGYNHIRVLREPVDIWSSIKDADGETILQKFYKEPAKYAFTFQVMAFSTRLAELKRIMRESPDCEIILCERSLEADGNIFAKMLHDDGLIESVGYQIYMCMYDMAIKEFSMDRVVYLNVAPDVCKERIICRGRAGEEDISVDYLTRCHAYHEQWLRGGQTSMIELNTDEDIEQFINQIHSL